MTYFCAEIQMFGNIDFDRKNSNVLKKVIFLPRKFKWHIFKYRRFWYRKAFEIWIDWQIWVTVEVAPAGLCRVVASVFSAPGSGSPSPVEVAPAGLCRVVASFFSAPGIGSPSPLEVSPDGYESLFTRICYIFARIAKIFADPFFSKVLNDCYWSFILTCFYFTSFLVFAENVIFRDFFNPLYFDEQLLIFFDFAKYSFLKLRTNLILKEIRSSVYAFGIFNLV